LESKDLISFENWIIQEYKKGNTYAPVHLSGGNEKQLIDIFRKIDYNDWVFTTHRSHYHALLKSNNPIWLMNEIISGYSSHINSKKYKIFSSSIVGGCIPIALGTALSIKQKGGKDKVWCFVGDMASEMGAYAEAVKYATNFNLPITFIIEDNDVGSNMVTWEVWGGLPQKYLSCPSPKEIYYHYNPTHGHYGVGEFIKFKKGFTSQGGMYY
jgi:TPP-dependent pyruvate/acetoin dehydrogenase alpha subunit